MTGLSLRIRCDLVKACVRKGSWTKGRYPTLNSSRAYGSPGHGVLRIAINTDAP
jgi:hypothetical protein